MYAGILRVHDVSRCAPLRKILKAPVTDPKKIAASLPTKKHRCLLISVRQRCFTQPPCGCAFFLARHFCSNVGTIVLYVGTIVLCQLRRFKARHLRDSRKRFHFLRQALSCRVSSAKEHRQRKGTKKRDKEKGQRKVVNK